MVIPEKFAPVPVPLRTTFFRSSFIAYAVLSFIAAWDSVLFSRMTLPLWSSTSVYVLGVV